MLIKALFWLLVALDVAALGLVFVLGLAAAGPSHTSPLAVTGVLLILPGVLLAGAVALFVFSGSPLWRGIALLVAAAPLLTTAGYVAYSRQQAARYQSEGGEFFHLPPGAARQLELAIQRDDAAAIPAAAAATDVNQLGRDGLTPLALAVRLLEKQPRPLDVVRALLAAGADPNRRGASAEAPLTLAIRASAKAGPEPVRLLLAAGADPNARTQFGEPAYFAAAGITVPPEVMALLLDHGADLDLRRKDGGDALAQTALTRNWATALLLLERGADPTQSRGPGGKDFRTLLESSRTLDGDSPALAEVLRFLERAEAAGRPER